MWTSWIPNPGPFAHHASTLLTQLSSHLVILLHSPPSYLDLSPNLLRTTLDQDINLPMPTVPAWETTKCHRQEKECGSTETRTQDLLNTMQAFYRLIDQATWSTHYMWPIEDSKDQICPRNGSEQRLTKTCPFCDAHSPSCGLPNVTGRKKKSDRNHTST